MGKQVRDGPFSEMGKTKHATDLGDDEFRFRPAESKMWDMQVRMCSRCLDMNLELIHQVPIGHLYLDVTKDIIF